MTYMDITARFLAGEIDSVTLSDRLRSLGYRYEMAEEIKHDLIAMKADRWVCKQIEEWKAMS